MVFLFNNGRFRIRCAAWMVHWEKFGRPILRYFISDEKWIR